MILGVSETVPWKAPQVDRHLSQISRHKVGPTTTYAACEILWGLKNLFRSGSGEANGFARCGWFIQIFRDIPCCHLTFCRTKRAASPGPLRETSPFIASLASGEMSHLEILGLLIPGWNVTQLDLGYRIRCPLLPFGWAVHLHQIYALPEQLNSESLRVPLSFADFQPLVVGLGKSCFSAQREILRISFQWFTLVYIDWPYLHIIIYLRNVGTWLVAWYSIVAKSFLLIQ